MLGPTLLIPIYIYNFIK